LERLYPEAGSESSLHEVRDEVQVGGWPDLALVLRNETGAAPIELPKWVIFDQQDKSTRPEDPRCLLEDGIELSDVFQDEVEGHEVVLRHLARKTAEKVMAAEDHMLCSYPRPGSAQHAFGQVDGQDSRSITERLGVLTGSAAHLQNHESAESREEAAQHDSISVPCGVRLLVIGDGPTVVGILDLMGGVSAMRVHGPLPRLELDEVSLGIAGIGELERSDTRYLRLDNFAEPTAASSDHSPEAVGHVIDLEREMCEALPVGYWLRTVEHVGVLEDLQRGTRLRLAWQEQVLTHERCTRHSGPTGEPFTTEIAARGDGCAAEDVSVEADEESPVAGDNAGMSVSHGEQQQ